MGLLFQRYTFLFFLKATNEERCCSLIFIQSWLAFGINFCPIMQWKVVKSTFLLTAESMSGLIDGFFKKYQFKDAKDFNVMQRRKVQFKDAKDFNVM